MASRRPEPVRRPSPVVRPGEVRRRPAAAKTIRRRTPVVAPIQPQSRPVDTIDAELRSRLQAIRGMSPQQVKDLQQKIGVAPDGAFGSGSQGALRAFLIKQRAESAERAAAADANRAKQRAEAERATADAEKARADAERARVEQARENRLADEADARRAGQIRLGSIAAGIVVAGATDKAVTSFIGKSADVRNAALASETKKLQGLIPQLGKPSTRASQRAAQKAMAIIQANKDLLRGRGPGGYVVAGVLAGKAAVEFGLATQYEEGRIEKTILNATATATTTTALLVTGTETFRRSQPQKFIAPEIRSAFAQAEALAKGATPGATMATAPVGAAQSAAAKAVALPGAISTPGRGAIGPTVAELRQQAKAAGITNASRMRKADIIASLEKAGKAAAAAAAPKSLGALGRVVRGVAGGAVRIIGRTLTPLAIGLAGLAGAAAYQQAKASGRTKLAAGGIGVGTAVDSFVGAPVEGSRRLIQAVAENNRKFTAFKPAASDPSGIRLRSAPVLSASPSRGRAYLNDAARLAAASRPKAIDPQTTPRAQVLDSSNRVAGATSYTTTDGRSVQGTKAQIAAWKKRQK